MNRQQEHLFTMLKEIHQICIDNGITYYLAMGSLIGAVRNGGFLPWDDDADILMARSEFERFKEACETDLPPNRALCSSRTVESFGFLLPRYISTETTAIHTAQSLHEDVSGEVIDIFLLDPIADGDEAYKNYVLDVNLYSEIINYANVCSARFNLPVELFDKYNAIREKDGIIAVSNALERRLERNFDENGHRYGFRWNGVAIPMERSWFEDVALVEFEGTKLMAPKGVNEFLTCYYGDEWTQVPTNITASKHNTAASLDVPYEDARDFYVPAEDLGKLRDDMYRRKRMCLDFAPEQNALKDEEAHAKAALAQLELERVLVQEGAALDKAFAAKDGKTIACILAPYLNAQLGGDLIGRHIYNGMARIMNPVLIDVNPTVFEMGLLALVCTERISKADRLLEVWRQAGRERTAYMTHIAELIARFRAATGCYQRRKIEEGLKLTHELLEELPSATSFVRLNCVFLLAIAEGASTPDNIARLDAACGAGLDANKKDGFYLEMKAECLRLSGNTGKARALALKAAELTRNGFALRRVFKLTGYHPSWYRTPKWAHAYDVEQWDGEEVDTCLNKTPEGSGDGRQQLLFTMLKELCVACDKHGIGYILAPTTAKAFAQHEALPAKMSEYAIVCEPRQAHKLARVLLDELPAGRCLDFCGNNSKISDLFLRYGATCSLYLKLATPTPNPTSTLSVRVLVGSQPERKDTLSRLRKRLVASLGKGRKARDTAALKSYAKRLTATGGASGSIPNGTKKPQKLSEDLFANTSTLEYAGHVFAVPAAFDKYTAKAVIATPASTLNCGKADIASVHFTLADLEAQGGFDASYYKKKAALDLRNVQAKGIYKRFSGNFKAIKQAVVLKEASIGLLAQKERICELATSKDIDGLSAILDPYFKLATKSKSEAALSFDAEIASALKLVQENTR